MSSRFYRRLLIFLLFFLCFLFAMIVSLFSYSEFKNRKIRTVSLGNIENNKDFGFSIVSNDSWDKLLPVDFVFPIEHQPSDYCYDDLGRAYLYGRTYTFGVENKTKYILSDWNMKINVNQNLYLNKAWNGKVEVHQFNDRFVDSFKTFKADNEKLNLVFRPYTELIVYPLVKGDFIKYHPDSSFMEVPLAPLVTKTVGMIIYSNQKNLVLDDIEFEYMIHRPLYTYPLFWIDNVFVLLSLMAIVGTIVRIKVAKHYELIRKHDKMITEQAVGTFAKFIDSKDQYTVYHSFRVASYSMMLAQALGFSREESENIYFVAMLHDVGKVHIPDSILNKPSGLNDYEFLKIKDHTVRGAEILKDFTALDNVIVGALYHHERYDGKGYPHGLKGEEIPIIARIICVADCYDAMSSSRCYRPESFKNDYIIDQLVSNKGKQFDPHIVDVFLECIKSGKVLEVRNKKLSDY